MMPGTSSDSEATKPTDANVHVTGDSKASSTLSPATQIPRQFRRTTQTTPVAYLHPVPRVQDKLLALLRLEARSNSHGIGILSIRRWLDSNSRTFDCYVFETEDVVFPIRVLTVKQYGVTWAIEEVWAAGMHWDFDNDRQA